VYQGIPPLVITKRAEEPIIGHKVTPDENRPLLVDGRLDVGYGFGARSGWRLQHTKVFGERFPHDLVE
jgi:hypothetical protein